MHCVNRVAVNHRAFNIDKTMHKKIFFSLLVNKVLGISSKFYFKLFNLNHCEFIFSSPNLIII